MNLGYNTQINIFLPSSSSFTFLWYNGHFYRMLIVKPYICRTQGSFSISDHPHPFSISSIRFNSHILNPISFRFSQFHPSLTIACVKRRDWSQASNRTILQLASAVAFNLKILPEPFNSIAGEIARSDINTLSRLVGGGRRRMTGKWRARKKESVWFALFFICIVGSLWSWKIGEFDLFLRVLSFCLAGISLIQLCLGKKAVKEWFLGFLFGMVLILSSKLRKEDMKFWIHKLSSLPVSVIATRKRSRNRYWGIFKWVNSCINVKNYSTVKIRELFVHLSIISVW